MERYNLGSNKGVVPKNPNAEARRYFVRAYFYMPFLYCVNSRHVVRYTDSMGLCRIPRDKIKNMRSSLIELIQCNRNPFIDHSEEAELILGF